MDEGNEWLRKPETIEELRSLPENELQRRHDQVVGYVREMEPLTRAAEPYLERARIYAQELARREAERQGERMEELTTSMVRQGERMEALTQSLNRLTWWIVVLTVLIAFATLVGVILTALALVG
jgi:hypothetical protein